MKLLLTTAVAATLSVGVANAAVIESTDLATFAIDATGEILSTFSFIDGVSNGSQDGSTYSPDFVLSSGPLNDSTVNDSSLEAGPNPDYDGLFTVAFNELMDAFSYSSYQFQSVGETIQFYDGASLVYSSVANSTNEGGFVFGGGMGFDSVVYSGEFYSLASISYSSADMAPVPLPATGLLLLGAFGLMGAARRSKKTG